MTSLYGPCWPWDQIEEEEEEEEEEEDEEEEEVTKRVTLSVYEKHLSSVLYEETFDFCHFV